MHPANRIRLRLTKDFRFCVANTSFLLSKKVAKPVLFTEIGYAENARAAAEPWSFHYGANPHVPLAWGVSSYHRLYNWVWFNNGYHAEHHYRPRVHWTRMKQLHEQIAVQLAANKTRILRGPHITALIEDWLTGQRSAQREGSKAAHVGN